MAEEPKSEYEAPSIEEVETEDAPAVTAAGLLSEVSDRRLKRSIRALESTIMEDERAEDPKSEYEAPSIEEVETEDAPAVTAAGDETLPPSDRRLKRSIRPLESTIAEDEMAEDPKSEYEAPSVEKVETKDAPAVTAAGDITGPSDSDRRLKRSIRPLEKTITQRR